MSPTDAATVALLVATLDRSLVFAWRRATRPVPRIEADR